MILSALLSLAIATGQPVSGQTERLPNEVPYCHQGSVVLARTSGPCQDIDLRALLDKLEVSPAETLAAQGFSGIRVFRYDGYSTIQPMVTFAFGGSGGSGGFAEARTVGRDGVVTTLRRGDWEAGSVEIAAVIAEIHEMRERPRASPPPWSGIGMPPPPPRLCLHAAVVIVEIIGAKNVDRWRPEICRPSSSEPSVGRVADVVASAFPECSRLPSERYAWATARLAACLMSTSTGSETGAAIEVIGALDLLTANQTVRPFQSAYLSSDIVFRSGDGRQLVGRDAVMGMFRILPSHQRIIQITRVIEDVDGVTVWAGPPRKPLSIRQRWVKGIDDRWRITDWSEFNPPAV